MCQMSWKSGSLNFLEPSGPHRACYKIPPPCTGCTLPRSYTDLGWTATYQYPLTTIIMSLHVNHMLVINCKVLDMVFQWYKIQSWTLYIPWLAESIATCKFTAKCLVICRTSITKVNWSDCCFSAASIHMLKLGSRLLSVSAYNSTRVFAADTDVNTWQHHLTCWTKTSKAKFYILLTVHLITNSC